MARRSSSFGIVIVISLFVSFAVSSIPAHAQTIEWVRQFGSNLKDQGLAIAKGPSGVYVTGDTAGVFPAQTSLAPGDLDAFVARYDEQGNLAWARQFGATTVAADVGNGIATDQTGTYVVGSTQGALQGQTSAGNEDAFIRKYDSNGNALWTRQFGTGAPDEALAVATDGTAVYVVGSTQGDLNSGSGGANEQAFIRRYDVNGTVVWTRQFGTADIERAYSVATDATGIYVAGGTNGELVAPSAGGSDGFLRKYDASGNVLWTRQFGTASTDDVFAVAAGGLGVYVGGQTVSTFPGQTKVGGLYDAFVVKFDVSGTQQWVRQLGTVSDDLVSGLAVGAASVVVAGNAGDTIIAGQAYTGSAFVQLYDFDGSLQGAIQFGNGANDTAKGVAADVTGAYVTGNKGGNALNTVPLGDLDAFAIKITLPAPTSLPFSITNNTGISTTTDGTGALTAGHATIAPSSGTAPSGVAIFGFRTDGVLVSEAGVPDSPLITSGRIYGEVSATAVVNTGLAIANPNDQTVTIAYVLVDLAGAVVKSGSRTVGPRAQVAEFLTEAPYSSGNGFQGTLTFNSTAPVGVIALRSLVNERNDFLITTLPVIDLSQPASTGTQVVPHFAVGDGWGTQIILVNPTDTAQTGTVQFLGPGSGSTPAVAATVSVDGTPTSVLAYSVAGRSSRKFVVSAAASGLTYGSVRIVPANAGPVPTPLVIFGYKPGPVTLSEAGVPVVMGTAFRLYVEASAAPVILSGVAISNTTTAPVTVTLELMTLSGASVGTSTTRTIPPSGQIVGFLGDFFPTLPQPFRGILRVSTPSGGVSVVALRQRYNERGDYLITTTPPTLETGTPTAATRSFPHIVNGGGYTTQFILFSGTAGQTSGGNMRFYRQNGTPMPLSLR